MVVAHKEAGMESYGRPVQTLAVAFYVYDGLHTSPRPYRIQKCLDVLIGLFDQVGL